MIIIVKIKVDIPYSQSDKFVITEDRLFEYLLLEFTSRYCKFLKKADDCIYNNKNVLAEFYSKVAEAHNPWKLFTQLLN